MVTKKGGVRSQKPAKNKGGHSQRPFPMSDRATANAKRQSGHANEELRAGSKWTHADWIQFAIAILSAGALIVTVVAAKGAWMAYQETKRQADIAQDQLDESKRSLTIGNRPWMAPIEANVYLPDPGSLELKPLNRGLRVGDSPSVEIVLKNVGNTPALDVSPGVSVLINSSLPPESFRLLPARGTTSKRPVGNGADYRVGDVLHGRLTAADVADITTPLGNDKYKAYLIIIGFVTYRDIFSEKPHTTRLCYYFDPHMMGMSGCPTHNSLD